MDIYKKHREMEQPKIIMISTAMYKADEINYITDYDNKSTVVDLKLLRKNLPIKLPKGSRIFKVLIRNCNYNHIPNMLVKFKCPHVYGDNHPARYLGSFGMMYADNPLGDVIVVVSKLT